MVENTYEKYVLPDQEFAKDSLSSRMPEEIPLLFNTNPLLETETLNVTEDLKLTTRFFLSSSNEVSAVPTCQKVDVCLYSVCLCSVFPVFFFIKFSRLLNG